MKYVTKAVLKDLDGKEIEDVITHVPLEFGKVLANIVVMEKDAQDPVRNLVLGLKLANNAEVELDKSEVSFLKECIKKNTGYFPLVRGQLLISLEEKVETKEETQSA